MPYDVVVESAGQAALRTSSRAIKLQSAGIRQAVVQRGVSGSGGWCCRARRASSRTIRAVLGGRHEGAADTSSPSGILSAGQAGALAQALLGLDVDVPAGRVWLDPPDAPPGPASRRLRVDGLVAGEETFSAGIDESGRGYLAGCSLRRQ